MRRFRSFFAGLVAVILLGVLPASAAEWKDFTAEEFAAAQAANKPILIDVFAAWCPTCRAQNAILVPLVRQPKFKDMVVLKIQFDTQKDELRALNVRAQSTLIVFKGKKELDRSAGDTSEISIEGMLDKTLL